jgi:hypothetical protein
VSISGSLADIAIVDLLQFVHMSQRSGTLQLERRGEEAHISFHRGRIASAWAAVRRRWPITCWSAGK